MLPGRLGLRFALEALFLVLVALGAGFADLRPALIVLVMAAAWLLVALVELTAERVSSSPVSYLLPDRAGTEREEDEEERVSWPLPEERTVVSPPEQLPAREPEPEPEPELPSASPEPAAEPEPPVEELRAEPAAEPEPPVEELPAPEPEPVQEPEPAAADEPVPAVAEGETGEEPRPRRLRSLLRRREREESPPEPAGPPRHVKLLPRRTAPEPSRATQEVAELFDEPEGREEHGR
ncbi:MAG TPA: hypothetical protein VLD13_09700 [Gaiellaceae bacterium]|nr:hypothetical protein [Gaiellaceae bacterium]